jgi:hypothetical protein
MEPLNNPRAVRVSRQSYEFDDHPVAYSVTDAVSGRLVGHVGKTRNAAYGRKHGSWCYLHTSDARGSWTLAGWSRAEAVDKLQSADSPAGAYVAGIA